jgi:hypothetical protein
MGNSTPANLQKLRVTWMTASLTRNAASSSAVVQRHSPGFALPGIPLRKNVVILPSMVLSNDSKSVRLMVMVSSFMVSPFLFSAPGFSASLSLRGAVCPDQILPAFPPILPGSLQRLPDPLPECLWGKPKLLAYGIEEFVVFIEKKITFRLPRKSPIEKMEYGQGSNP